MASMTAFTKHADRWEFDVSRALITDVSGEYTAEVSVIGHWGALLIVLEGDVIVSRPGRAPERFDVAPGIEMLSPVLGPLPMKICSLTILRSGELTMKFGNSVELTTVVDPDYESCQVFDPSGTMFRSGPGPNVGVYPPL